LNLNIRKSAKSFSTTGTSSGPATTTREQELPTFTHWATDDSCAIRALFRTICFQLNVRVPNVRYPSHDPHLRSRCMTHPIIYANLISAGQKS
jgi:hypothetical protein